MTIRGVLAVVGALVLCGCGATGPTGPTVSDFRTGSCRQVASDIIDVAAITRAVAGGQTAAAAAQDQLTTDQGHLASAAAALADPSIGARLRTVITDVGYVRFTVDHHTFDGSQGTGLARDVAALETACIPARQQAS